MNLIVGLAIGGIISMEKKIAICFFGLFLQ